MVSRSAVVCRRIRKAKAGARQRFASPSPTWCRPMPICWPRTPASLSIAGRANVFALRSTRAHTAPPAAHPIERLAQERERLHPLPSAPYTAVFGVSRKVGSIWPVVQFEGGEYSVPDDYVGQEVWVRQQDDEIVIVLLARDGAHEIKRWTPTVPGQPRHDPADFGPPPEGPLQRTPKSRTADEAAFLDLGVRCSGPSG